MSVIYPFELPTTGSFSFAESFVDYTDAYTASIAETTQVRANLRAILKESKRTDGEKDHLRLVKVLDEYLPNLHGIMNCAARSDIVAAKEPDFPFTEVFSWRTTLSAHLFNNSPRLNLPSLLTELAFTLLTYGFALSNLAHSTVISLGTYERERGISDIERKAKDEKLGFAVNFLSRASGVFAYVGDVVLVEAEKQERWMSRLERPPELSKEVCSALSKMTTASAQSLAIRKLLTKSAPHRQMHLECASLCSSALSLARIPGSSKARLRSPTGKSKLGIGFGKDKDRDSQEVADEMEVSADLLRFLTDSAAYNSALAHKWLGVDAGEAPGSARVGEAVAFLTWSKKELDELKESGKRGSKEDGKEGKRERKERVVEEIESVTAFLRHYKKVNDSLSFQSVPPLSALQSSIPTGRLAVAVKPYTQPVPAFGPGSVEYMRKQAEEMELLGELAPKDDGEAVISLQSAQSYAGAGSYF
ncbi:hypothetical protein EW146_g8655 [Bondarzewia mesenterica]|uniref:pH-response regulator protein palC n=1 Tax=Bondarzewia mesenterica TaxID=1095465 RepID=A0A4S4LCY4_9AGAM|nr:hypothetical protein EW146_g8655 [Bondarzewia mesenterica]